MNRAAARIVLGAALALLLAGVVWWWLGGRGERAARQAEEAAAASAEPLALPVELHFPAGTGGLGRERRQLATTRSPRDQVQKIVEALLAGPQTAGLVRPLPAEVTVGGVVLVAGNPGTGDAADDTGGDTGGGIVYVDLRWAGHEDPPPGGSMAEMQTVYSLVNSIALNVREAPRVVLLWNGSQRLSFSGHLDTSVPLTPNQALAR